MEDLTKHQLILLVLLITFITSIGTSIISFSLLQEAPVEVTQTINRVVEKTIERVVTEPGETKTQTEKVIETVVVSEEDRVVEAISKNEKSIVRLRTPGADGTSVISGMGVVVSADGTIMVDSRSYNSSFPYSIEYYDGKVYQIGKVEIRSKDGLVFIKPSVPEGENPKYTFHAATLGDSNSLKIGQTIVALGGRESNSVSMGRVKQFETNNQKTVLAIVSDIVSGRSLPGSPILSLSGEIMGIEAPIGDSATYRYIPINSLKTAKTEALAELAK